MVRLRDFWRHLPETPGQQDLSKTELETILVDWIETQQPGGIRGADVQAFLQKGSALLILDGVDEVPLTRGEEGRYSYPRAMLISGLSAAAETWVERGHRLLVTSRPYGMRDADQSRLGLPHAPINELSEPMQELLVRRWFQILAPDRATGTETADELLGEIRTRGELEPLVANPMLMTAICVIYSQGKRLPQDKYELYDRIVDNVLYNRYRDPAMIDLERSRLSILAYGMHTGHGLGEMWTTPHAEVSKAEIDRILQAYKEHSPWTEQGYRSVIATREQLLSRTGILLPRGDHRAAFYHFTFQDFLAAQWLQDVEGESLLDVFRERAPFDEWHNTLSFVFSALLARSTSPNRSTRLLGQLIEAIDEDTLGLAVVAAECLSILMGRKYRMKADLEQQFREICLSAIEREVPVQPRCTLGLALGRLGDPRPGVGLRKDKLPDIDWVPIPEGRIELEGVEGTFEVKAFQIARHPVTWAQYRAFVEDPDGYANRDWWDRLTHADTPGHQYFRFENCPADNASWYDAMAFCRWLTRRYHDKGLIPQDRVVRLPTEWEWQQAATGGDSARIYPWGPEWEEGLANTHESGLSRTTAVGIYPKGTWADGPLDLAGNVWEWCLNKYDKPRETTPDVSNDWRVLRGGSWFGSQGGARAGARFSRDPDYRYDDGGFRVCCSSPID